ncbi:isochorismatase family protein [Rhizobium halophytocola]|uniref:Nicotinamidase-related amidase n=1 Tax=Rhizobium halophytocola TaxID=735519 RepID=A0ABS4E020_9HYPH|nr:isochorismatase family protein [Rhizobium halophytocola]MBP1851254.1 nicotinamidase-related amidase [Rhizobium halophytocola]
MSYTQTALLVIDVQQSFRHRDYWQPDEAAAFLAKQQALIDGAVARGIPVIQIFHNDGDGPFSTESGHVRTLDGLRIAPDAVFTKSRHSAFVGTGLDVWLTERGIRKLIVSGIRTEQCCETTTRHGSDKGYAVDYVTEATLTFPMTHADGTVFSAADIRKRTELVLSGRFARIVTVAEALAMRQDEAA